MHKNTEILHTKASTILNSQKLKGVLTLFDAFIPGFKYQEYFPILF